MRHMRSRRILAMLLALSMIFGLLTTTALADNEVDQNPSNVEESTANSTSEGGSSEGQSSGASEDESSTETNKEDVLPEEETTPEEKKTTSDEEVDTLEGEGENADALSDYITVNNGETQYATLEAAIAAAEPENGVITYTVHGSVHVEKDGWIEIVKSGLTDITKVEFVGSGENAEISTDAEDSILNEQTYGVDVIFNNLTLSHPNGKWVGNTGHGAVYFTTWVHDSSKTVTYTNCKFPNGACDNQYGTTVFSNCEFKNNKSDVYNLWNYGGNTKVTDCTFIGTRGIKVYNEGKKEASPNLEIKNTTFTGLNEKAAIVVSKPAEIKLDKITTANCVKGTFEKAIESSTEKITISANGSDISGTFGVTETTGAAAAKEEFNISAGSFTGLTADNIETFKDYLAPNTEIDENGTVSSSETPATGVAKVGNETFDTLEEAFAALNSTNYTLELLVENAWTGENVYWTAGEQKGYADTLAAALTAAYKAKADYITIICRPGADVGTMTHGHVADNITIYGNKAYISGGECDLEVDTYKFSRETGKQAADGEDLGKDITITAYELDNLGVWGQRNTDYTVNVNLTDCDTVQGITVQHVYISGETGVNNITLSGCDFGTKATSVYSNADGDINITNCSFTGAQVPVNFNHKTGGEQTLRVSNCKFNACGDAGEWKQFAAPVRFVNSGSGSQTASVNACTFADTVGSNGDILIGDGRTGQNSNDVNLTVTDTEANIQAQKPGYYNGNETDTNKLGTVTSPASGTLTTSVEKLISGGSTGTTNVAKIGETEYATLEEAIAKAEAGQTVTLIADVNTRETTYVVSKNLTIDLNGKTVTGSGYDGVFRIDGADAKVLIKNGNVVAVEQSGSAGKYAMAVWACAENCVVTLEGLTVTQDITHTDDKQMDMIYTSKGTIIINSGSFTSGTPAWTLNCKDAAFKDGSATIIVNGGMFTGFDPCNNAAEGKGTSFVAEGVGVDYDENGSFTAKANMTAQLLDADGNSVKAYASLADAIAAAGQTVRLLADATENIEIATDKNITLDLNGHTINGGTGTAKATITNNGTVKITDSSTDKTGTIKRDDQGVKDETSYYVIRNIGTMTIEQAIVTNNSGYAKPNPSGSMVGSSLICNGDNNLGGTLNISGGTFEQQNFLVIKNGALGTLNVTGGTFTSKHSAIQNWFKANITGGEIKGQLWTDSWKVDESVGETTIGGNATFTGEIVMGISKSDAPAPTLAITGGKLDVTNWRVTPAAAKAGAKPAVSGGTFSSAVAPEYCAEGFEPKDNGDGTFGVKEISAAKIGNIEYETLAAAFAEAKDGDTIVLLKDSSGNGIVVEVGTFADKGLTVDFNNHSYTVGGVLVGSSGTASNGFQLNKDNKITFKNGALYGDASVAGDETTNWTGAPAIMIQNYSNLTLDGMTVVGGKETCYTLSNNNGDTLIKNSTITAGEASTKPAYQPARAFDVCGYSTYTGVSVSVENSTINGNIEISKSNGNTYDATLTLGSGTTVKGSISDGGNGDKVTVTKDKSVSVAAPDGYKWVDGENGQTLAKIVMVAEVKGKPYETLQAAINAARKGETVKLLNDTKENVTISKMLTLDLNGKTLNGGQEKGKPALTVTDRVVTVKDSSEAQTGTIKREDTAENSGVSSHYVIDVQGNGWLTFESGNVINDSGVVGVKGASLVRVGDDSVAKQPGLVINGGSFRQNNFIAIKVDRGYLTLKDGTITSKNSYAIENWFNATIKGGTVNGTVASWTYSGGSNSTTTITGGTINGNVNSVNYGNAVGKTAKVTISGGTVNGELDTRSYDPTTNELTSIDDAAKATIGVTGGTFSKNPTKYVVEGLTVKKNEDGTFGVEKAPLEYLAKVGETSYYTMDEAFHAAVASGETLHLLRDYTTNSEQNSGSNSFTIDLNGHTWTYTGTATNRAAFEINYPNVTLTVMNGTVVSNSMIGLIPSVTERDGTTTYDNSGLVFESVQATANGNSGIETNGNNTNDTVTLKDSTLNVPNGFGIYFPSSGKLTIDNSKITAMTMGVQVCSGSLDIKGQNAAITVNGDPVPKTENDGAIQDGAAISIVNRTGYKGLGTITVTEGTFKAKKGNDAVKAYDWVNKEAGEATFTAFDKVAISGGSYSTVVPADLCAEGFVPVTKANADGLFEVEAVEGDAELLDADGKRVKYGNLEDLLKDAAKQTSYTVKLIKDAALEDVKIRNTVTLDLNGHILRADYVSYFGGNMIDSSSDNSGLLKTLNETEIMFNQNTKATNKITQIPVYSTEKQGYMLLTVNLVTLKVGSSLKETGTFQAMYAQKLGNRQYGWTDLQKQLFSSTNESPVKAGFRLVYNYTGSKEQQTFEFVFLDEFMQTTINNSSELMYVTVTGLDSSKIENITIVPILVSDDQVELCGNPAGNAFNLFN